MKILWTLSFLLFALGCSTPERPVTVQSVLESNRSATTAPEWEHSEHQPEKLFELWKKQQATDPGLACRELEKLNSHDLSLFESQILKPENQELLQECRAKLLRRLEGYWEEERNQIPRPSLRQPPPRFETETIVLPEIWGQRIKDTQLRKHELVLSFDDGPDRHLTPQLLKILSQHGVKAHFFILGQNALRNPRLVRKMAEEGHRIGSHSYSHLCLVPGGVCSHVSPRVFAYSEAKEEILKGHQAIEKILGWVDPFFRFPYQGSDSYLRSFIAEKHLYDFDWTIDSKDWKVQSARDLYFQTLKTIESEKSGIVLFHDIQRRTLEIMDQLLGELSLRGYKMRVYSALSDPRQL